MDIFAVETLSGKIKIEYTDGSSEEVKGLLYERKNTSGDTVEERLALPADTERLAALAASFEASLPTITAPVSEVNIIGTSIEIKYADGTKEEISNGVYERKDSNNETIVERAATQADTDRLTAIADAAPPTGPSDDGTPDQGPGDTPDPDKTPGETPGETPGDDGITETGSEGNDRISTGAGDDSVEGNGGDDRIRTKEGDDTVKGGDGDDRMRGDSGNDVMDGGSGDDRMRGDSGNDTMNGGSGDDRMRGDAGDDSMTGGFGDDRLRGDAGNDNLHGNDGDDRVTGDQGDDTLNGGNGEDIYKGGMGADTFVFEADGEEDIIKDFQAGVDVIDLTAYGFSDASEFMDAATERKGDTYIDLGGGDVIKLDNFALANLSADDFLF